jgi:hypothetical protein
MHSSGKEVAERVAMFDVRDDWVWTAPQGVGEVTDVVVDDSLSPYCH